MEQKETDAAEKAGKLMSTFEKSFLHVRSTFHPPGLQGEIAGKSSNVAFAARHIVQVHRNELSTGSCNVVVTVMDGEPFSPLVFTFMETILMKQRIPISGKTTSLKSVVCITPISPTRQTEPYTPAPSSSTATPTKALSSSAARTSSGASPASPPCTQGPASPSRPPCTPSRSRWPKRSAAGTAIQQPSARTCT